MSTVTDSIQAALDEERGVANSRGNYHTLKLERQCSALVRFLPTQLGPRKTWFARIARHWVGGRPYVCEQKTSADFGGNPDARCPLCDLEAKYIGSRDEAIKKEASRMGAFPKWLTYVFIWEMTDERGRVDKTPKASLYAPNEFWLTRDSFNETLQIYDRTKVKSPELAELGFLHPLLGNDCLVTRDSRNGTRITKEDPMPILDGKTVDELFDLVDQAMAKVKLPDTQPLTPEQMGDLVMKAEDKINGGRSNRGRSASEVDYDDSPRRGASRREAEPAAEPRRGDARREPAPEQESRQSSRRSAEPAPATVARRSATPAAAEPELEPERGPEPAAQAGDEPPPSVRGGRRSAPPPPAREAAGDHVDDGGEELPPERRDLAPPPERRTAATPPPARAQTALSDDMRSRVRKLGGTNI